MEAKIAERNGKLFIYINGKEVIPSAYMTYVAPQGNYEAFKKIGYNLFFGCVQMGDTFIPFTEHVWKSENEYDFTPVKEVLDKIIGSSEPGEIYVILRVNLNVPKWWAEKYPDEVMRDENGNKWLQSSASEKWRDDCVKFLSLLQDFIVNNGYDEYVAGFHLAGLATEEWYIPESGKTVYDFSPVGTKAFRDYCLDKYRDIDTLDNAYNSNYKSFEDIKVPLYSERYVFSYKKQYRDLPKDSIGADYYEFCGESVASAIIYLADKTKKILHYKKLVGAFYGYTNVLPAWNGHTSIKKILACGDIDFLASPLAYVNLRQGAFDWFYNGAVNSAKNANKIWFTEADVRTYLTRPLPESYPPCLKGKDDNFKKRYYEPVWHGPKTEEKSKHHLTRALGKVICSESAFWWFDMWGGWYNSDGLMKHISELENLYRKSMSQRYKSNVEIAVLVDESMSVFTNIGNFAKFIVNQFVVLGFVGAPYDIYLFSDLEKADFSDYKTLIFISALQITDKQAERIEKLKSGGRSLMFSGLTGLYSKNFDRILGMSSTEETVEKEFKDYRIVYSSEENFSAEQIRNALKTAGGHIYSEMGDIVYANERYIVLTATNSGKRRLYLPSGKRAEIVINKKDFIVKGNEIEIETDIEETVIFEIKG